MSTRTAIVALILFIAILLVTACRDADLSSGEKIIKSTKSGEMTVTLSSATGGLKNGENELMVTFTDASGKPVDVGAASLNFHMAAMGTMAEMNDKARLTTTNTPGRYRAQVDIEMAGTWDARVKYQGQRGSGQESMAVRAK